MSVLDELPDKWSGMQREWEMVAEMVDATPPSVITHGWEYIGTNRLLERSNSISLSGMSCGLASGGAIYQALHIIIQIDGGSGATDRPLLFANGDNTQTNYYGVAGNNLPRIHNQTIAAGTSSIVITGFLYRDNSMAAASAQYIFGTHEHINTYAGSIQGGTGRAWKWLNPGSADVLTSLEVTAPTNDFEIGSQLRVWGIRPGI